VVFIIAAVNINYGVVIPTQRGGETASLFIAYIFVVGYLLFIAGMGLVATCMRSKLASEAFIDRFGEFFDQLHYSSTSLWTPFVFILRRLAIVVAIFALSDNSCF